MTGDVWFDWSNYRIIWCSPNIWWMTQIILKDYCSFATNIRIICRQHAFSPDWNDGGGVWWCRYMGWLRGMSKRCGCDYLDRCEPTKYFTILGRQQCILDTVFTICNSRHFDHMFILVHETCKPFIWKHASLTQVGLTTECVHIWLIQRIEGMVLFDLLQNQIVRRVRAYTMNH